MVTPMEMVQTSSGRVRGRLVNGFWEYRGIPFAAPPVGDRRFLPPSPAAPWKGILDAARDGIRPWQKPAPWATDSAEHEYGEDCLNLNIWVPEKAAGPCPVVVLIFGGGHFEGSNCEIGMTAQPFVGRENIVMVAPNYRVGPLGYLYLRHLLGEDYACSGNLGLLDQIAALRWVRDNIAAFGGDPSRVTLMGQSAGAKSIASLIASPLAEGLFRQCILMSGGLQCIKDEETEKALTRNFLQSAGLDEGSADRLKTLSPQALLEAQEKANETFFKAESYGATADGLVIPKDFIYDIRRRGLRSLKILIGHTKEELCFPPGQNVEAMSGDALYRRLVWKFGKNADHVMQVCRRRIPELGFARAFGETMTEYTYVQACLRTASCFASAGAATYLYRWDAPGAPVACHSSDLETAFCRRQDILPAAAERLREMLRRFITDGTPEAAELPSWETCSADRLTQMVLGERALPRPVSPAEMDADFPLQVMRL